MTSIRPWKMPASYEDRKYHKLRAEWQKEAAKIHERLDQLQAKSE